MANITAHECSGIDCMICIEAERAEAHNRLESWREGRVKKFTAPRSKRSVTLSAKPALNYAVQAAAAEQETAKALHSYEDAGKTVVQDSVVLDDMTGRLNTVEAALKFITAGNAYFTVRSLKTGTRYTFRVNRPDCSRCGKRDCGCWAHPALFVALLAGPDNSDDYLYMGMIRDNVLRTTRGSKMRQDAVPFRAFVWVWSHLQRNTMPPQTEIWHDGRCGRCGRHLTVPSSVLAGLGPDCEAMMQ